MTGVGFFRSLPLIWQGFTSTLGGKSSRGVSLEKYYRAAAELVSEPISAKGLSCLCTICPPGYKVTECYPKKVVNVLRG